MSTQQSQLTDLQATEKQDPNKRLKTIRWALFQIMIGGSGIVPK